MGEAVLALVGPTCTGKSGVAFALARRLGCAVLSADSMQVYRGMDIGTGKAFDDRNGVHTYGIDLVGPNETYSAALFQEYGREIIQRELDTCGRIIICGGTGFYVRALLDDMDFAPGDQTDNPVRDKYTRMLAEEGPEAVWEALRALDEASALSVHPNNAKRVIRALEMAEVGESYAERAEAFAGIAEAIPATYVMFDLPRPTLYARINARVDAMMAAGLVAEVQGLLDAGLAESSTARAAIGYKEIIAALAGECSMEQAVEAIKQATRRFAKRQISWFKRDERIVHLDGRRTLDERVADVEALWLS